TKYSPENPMSRVANPYPEMSQEEIMKIEIPSKTDCILWLWTTNGFMKDAYELLEEWGFAPKTILTWNKINIGVGYWLRNVTEHCILAVKGSPVWDNKKFSTLISEKRTEHSAKPQSFYDMVDKLCVGRKLDYFARKKRAGWDVFGDEV
ncbi:MAG TPA: MT-A70 family methyltransferase, partial [Clostridia bacterium]|nr:MT-A70 family methyltransferase [Clostridia bacterium]